MSWERVLRMFGIHREPLPDDLENPELTKARQDVEDLHLRAEKVLDDYAIAEQERRK